MGSFRVCLGCAPRQSQSAEALGHVLRRLSGRARCSCSPGMPRLLRSKGMDANGTSARGVLLYAGSAQSVYAHMHSNVGGVFACWSEQRCPSCPTSSIPITQTLPGAPSENLADPPGCAPAATAAVVGFCWCMRQFTTATCGSGTWKDRPQGHQFHATPQQ